MRLGVAVGFSAVALGNVLYSATANAWIADTVPLNVRSAVGTIAFSDRIGQLRSARYGLAIMCLSSAGLAVFEHTLLLGIAALFLLLFGFEFALISTKPVIAELASSERSYALGFAESAGIVGRAGGAVLGAILFERYGMPGPALATGLSGIVALGLIGLHEARA